MRICDRCRAMLAMSLAALSDLDAESELESKIRDDAIDLDCETLYDLLAHCSIRLNVVGWLVFALDSNH